MQLKPIDERYLRIFLISLEISKSSLPTMVQREVHEVGLNFLKDPFSSIDRLWEIGNYDCLKEYYVEAIEEFGKLEHNQERSKFGLPEGFSGEEDTTEIPSPTVNGGIGELGAVELIDVIHSLKPIKIFLASDSVAAIHSYIEKVRTNIENSINVVSYEVREVSSIEILTTAPLIYE